jgi:hypothetical protein
MTVDLGWVCFRNSNSRGCQERWEFSIEWPDRDGSVADRGREQIAPAMNGRSFNLLWAEGPEDLAGPVAPSGFVVTQSKEFLRMVQA